MTAGHLEIQAMRHAVREITNVISTVKGIINHVPLPGLSEDQHGAIERNLESFSGLIQQFPGHLTTIVVMRKEQVDELIRDRHTVAKFGEVLQMRLAAVDSEEKQLVVEAEAFQANRKAAAAKMKEAVKMLRAAEKKEKLLACRERRVVGLEEKRVLEKFLNPGTDGAADDEADADPVISSEDESSTSSSEILSADAGVELVMDSERRVEKWQEEKAVHDLHFGADATIEDAAEAAAAERRVMERPNSPTKKPARPAAENDGETSPADLEKQQSHTTHASSSERDLLGPDTIAAKEERLWQRETHLASQEFYVQNREAAVLRRERLLAELKRAQMQVLQDSAAQFERLHQEVEEEVEQMKLALYEQGEELRNQYRYLMTLRGRLREWRDMLRDQFQEWRDSVRDLMREARGLVGASGEAVVLEQETREKVSDFIAEARGLIRLRDEVREMQDRVSELVREARGLVGAGGGDAGDGEDEVGDKGEGQNGSQGAVEIGGQDEDKHGVQGEVEDGSQHDGACNLVS